MSFAFVPAVREQVSLLIALAGASGSGKTKSALRLAQGISPEGKIAFIDTEARRGLHYADQHTFLHLDMRPPFTPARFTEALVAAEKAGVEVVIVDNFSDEYEGEGGICEWAEKILQGGTKSPGNWNVPKTAHKQMMNRIMQMRVSVIFCLRADERIKIDRENGKTVVTPLGWMWIAEKRFHYFMTASFILTPDKPGIPRFDLPHKLQEQHRGFFPEGRFIDEACGQKMAVWAKGGVVPASEQTTQQPTARERLYAAARAAADRGIVALADFRRDLDERADVALAPILDELMARAADCDSHDDTFPGDRSEAA